MDLKKVKKYNRIPDFKQLKPLDSEEIKMEILKNKYKFSKNVFFKLFNKPKHWITFYDNMEQEVYNKGEIIYQEGKQAKSFYIISRGKIQYLLNKEKTEELRKYNENLLKCFRHKSVFHPPSNNKRSEEDKKTKNLKVRMSVAPQRQIEVKFEKENEEINNGFSNVDEEDNQELLRSFEFFQPKFYFGEFELFDKNFSSEHSNRKFTAVAASKCVLFKIDGDVFLDIVQNSLQHAEFMENFLYPRYDFVEKSENDMVQFVKKQITEICLGKNQRKMS